jgi:glycosyltransferase involved in cell wall biosynthesis
MKILVLTSRYTATKDIIGEDFGRQMRLFSALQKRGHKITLYVADYRKKEHRDTILNGMDIKIRPFGIFSFPSFAMELKRLLNKERWDVFVATGDPLWGVIGHPLAKKSKAKMVFDWHDNYETYLTYKLPLMGMLTRQVTKKFPYVLSVTRTLKGKISPFRKGSVEVIENGVDLSVFKPMDRKKCRKDLKLTLEKSIIAYTGSLQRYEGTHRLLEMFKKLREDTDCILVIAGRIAEGEGKYFSLKQEGVIYLGSLPQKDVAKVINAANVAIIPYDSNIQTTYGFPYKLFEYMACQVPIVATRVGDIPLILKGKPEHLCSDTDINDMVRAIKRNLAKKKINYGKELRGHTWDDMAKKLERYLAA